MAITSDEFLERLKSEAIIPSNQVRFDDENLLTIADQETQSTMMPFLLSIRQEYLVKFKEVPLAAQQKYLKIPSRAVGRTIRDLKLKDQSGQVIWDVPYISLEDRNEYDYTGNSGDPYGFTLMGDQIVFIPASGVSRVAVVYYELKPSKLIPVADAGVITNINTLTGDVTIAISVPEFQPNLPMDIIDNTQGNSVLGEDLLCTNVSGNVLTFNAAEIDALVGNLGNPISVGNYVAIGGQSPVLQIPDELVDSLVCACAKRLLSMQGDFEGAKDKDGLLKDKMTGASRLLAPRVQSEVPKIFANNGLLRRRSGVYQRYRFTPS